MNQKEFVKNAIATADNDINLAVDAVAEGLMNGECPFKGGPITDERRAKSYAKSVVSNYLKKDPELNGGEKYVPKTTRGPRYKNPEIKELADALKALHAHGGQEELIGRVEARLTALKAEEDAQRSKKSVMSIEDAMAKLEQLGVG